MAEKLEDILTRFGDNVAGDGAGGQGARPRLAPDRHPVRDFFVADILDCAFKDDRASMEHPFFSLSKKTRTANTDAIYEHNGNTITIEPGPRGLATIWDKDILIYAISQIVARLNEGLPVTRRLRLKAYDLLVATNRHTDGKNYERLAEALRRLAGTSVETNILTNGHRVCRGFGLLDNWETIEKTDTGRMISVELTLNEWLFNAAVAKEVLTLSRDYFRDEGEQARARSIWALALKRGAYRTSYQEASFSRTAPSQASIPHAQARITFTISNKKKEIPRRRFASEKAAGAAKRRSTQYSSFSPRWGISPIVPNFSRRARYLCRPVYASNTY